MIFYFQFSKNIQLELFLAITLPPQISRIGSAFKRCEHTTKYKVHIHTYWILRNIIKRTNSKQIIYNVFINMFIKCVLHHSNIQLIKRVDICSRLFYFLACYIFFTVLSIKSTIFKNRIHKFLDIFFHLIFQILVIFIFIILYFSLFFSHFNLTYEAFLFSRKMNKKASSIKFIYLNNCNFIFLLKNKTILSCLILIIWFDQKKINSLYIYIFL